VLTRVPGAEWSQARLLWPCDSSASGGDELARGSSGGGDEHSCRQQVIAFCGLKHERALQVQRGIHDWCAACRIHPRLVVKHSSTWLRYAQSFDVLSLSLSLSHALLRKRGDGMSHTVV